MADSRELSDRPRQSVVEGVDLGRLYSGPVLDGLILFLPFFLGRLASGED